MLKYCLGILKKYKTPKGLITHSLGVYKVSKLLAKRLKEKGFKINREAVLKAALLHDVDKIYTVGKPQEHGTAVQEILKKENVSKEVFKIIKNHTASRIFERNFFKLPLEDKVVYYADKIFEQQICSLEERIIGWQKRYGLTKDKAQKLLGLMKKIEREILKKADITGEELKNLV